MSKVFVSFKYHDNKNYKNLLKAWSANKNFEFVFNDNSSGEIQSSDIDAIKRALSRKINECDTTLVIVGENTNKKDPNNEKIGYRNWQIYEIEKSKENNNSLVAVKISSTYDSPEELKNCGVEWVMSFNQDNIVKAFKNI